MQILAIAGTLWLTLPIATWLATTPAMADDGDGDGDGGGGSGGGSGGGGSAGSGGGYDNSWRRGRSYYGRKRYRARRAARQRYRAERRTKSRRARRTAARPAVVRAPSPREIVAAGLTDAAIAELVRQGFSVTGDQAQSALGLRVTRLAIPQGRSLSRALRLAKEAAGDAVIAPNDLYRRPRARFRTSGEFCGVQCASFEVTAWTASLSRCATGLDIGMIDTPIELGHPVLEGARIEQLSTARADREAAGTNHGTGVASLLVGNPKGKVAGVVETARLIAVNAFHAGSAGDEADTFDLVAALRLLGERGIKVVNMSLAGPDNALLEREIGRAVAAGQVIVAAAGEPGRASGFPARYPGVIAVTAIDERLRSSRRSARGAHVAFAAPGVGLTVAGDGGSLQKVEGSSFAAPFVAAAYAVGARGDGDVAALTERLAAGARDLGPKGRDPIFGWGVVQYTALGGC
ncbi:MAG: S8 family serine peptidase [Rhizobiales bacterium]|nr:S8 family serine peptidase [Hyphomicrobiales bacterium]